MNVMLPAAVSLLALALAPGPVTTKTTVKSKSKSSKVTKSKGHSKQAKVAKFTPAPGKTSDSALVAQPKAVERLLASSKPPKMTKAKLSKASELEITEVNWAVLSPTRPKRNGRASMSFYRPHIVDSRSARAVFTRRCNGSAQCQEGGALVRVNAAQAGVFVVSCSLLAGSEGVGNWVVRTSAGRAELNARPGWNDVTFVIQANEPGSYGASITGKSRAWALSSCSINKAD